MIKETKSFENPRTTTTTPNDEEIRIRAYELYEQRGREPGHELDDWVSAEQELSAPVARKVAA